MSSLLEKTIGYQFRDPALLREALTHSSYVNEHPELRKQDCNERLEFLGDAVLETLASRNLFFKYPDLMEGELTKKRAACVSERGLGAAAKAIGLGDHLRLGKGMGNPEARTNDSILSDAFEALLAAIYLDGGETAAEALVQKYVLVHAEDVPETDAKTALQERLQERGLTVTYQLIKESGPDHDRSFEYAAVIGGKTYGTGTGKSKKAAQSEAAANTIEILKGN